MPDKPKRAQQTSDDATQIEDDSEKSSLNEQPTEAPKPADSPEAAEPTKATDSTNSTEPAEPAKAPANPANPDSPNPADETETTASVGASAALISACTIISRITGFARTWAMAFALGATFVSSSYQVANNLPNMLYELVMGGLLATAFLPVYLSIKKRSGKERSEEYASNLLTIVVVGLGIVAVLCIIFSAQIIFTQSFYSDQDEMELATFFFRFFALQILFYGGSAILSGLLNANRDYFWGAAAPIANNIIVIAAFLIYAALVDTNPTAGLYVIAIGGTLGVFVQMAFQIPALRRNGIKLRPHINFHDPGLRETVSIGLPAVFVTICSFVVVSVSNAASYCFADNGPSVIAYSRLWFTFPYSFLAVPVATAMFTELADMQAANNTQGVTRGITNGSSQIFFLMIPFALYLIVFSVPLVTLYHMGAFTTDNINQIANYLVVMAIALPFYGVTTYLQMIFSSIRKMKAFSIITFAASAVQVIIIAIAAWAVQTGFDISMESIAVGTIASYVIINILGFAYLRHLYKSLKIGTLLIACLRSLGLGALGAAAGFGVLFALETFVAPLDGSILQAFIYIVIGGAVSLVVTFGPALALKLPEAQFVTGAISRIGRRLRRSKD